MSPLITAEKFWAPWVATPGPSGLVLLCRLFLIQSIPCNWSLLNQDVSRGADFNPWIVTNEDAFWQFHGV